MTQITVAEFAGVCFGVRRALDLLDEAVQKGAELKLPVFMFGPLIHNPRVIEAYHKKGVAVIGESELQDNAVIVIRSHGITAQEEAKLKSFKNVNIIDTTCPFVKRIHRIVAEKSREGYGIIVLGDENHSEVKGFTSRINGSYIVVAPDVTPDNFTSLELFLKQHNKVFAVAQTTCQPIHFDILIDGIKGGIATGIDVVFEYENTVCDATFQRQNAARKIAESVDAMVVIGGKNSSNTSKLYNIIADITACPIWVESINDFSDEEIVRLKQTEVVGVTAGASTPDDQIQELVLFLEAL